MVATAPLTNSSATAIVLQPFPVVSLICAITESMGPSRYSSMSKPWHWVSIRLP